MSYLCRRNKVLKIIEKIGECCVDRFDSVLVYLDEKQVAQC